MNNHEFCAQWILDQGGRNTISVLDYGCGAGEIVQQLRALEVNAFGCDIFYQGGDRSRYVAPHLCNGIIRKMEDGCIPFESASFDFVINNQVMEHVENIDRVLAEISRVLKPGGTTLSLFPDKGVWREGHCGVPFLHWFPKGSRLRLYYASVCRTFGLGFHKGNKSVMRWSEDFCDYLDRWTHYRSPREIYLAYDKYFDEIRHIEEYWLQKRFGARKTIATLLPLTIQRLVVRKLAGLVFVARKPKSDHTSL